MTGIRERAGRPRPTAVATVLLAASIFAVDTFTSFSFAIAVLYVLVVFLAANVFDRRRVLQVGGVCILLILIAFLARHDLGEPGPVARALMSTVAVVVATGLIWQNMKSTEAIAGQAALLDLTHDAIFARAPDDRISSWNRGAEAMYGWSKEEAIGRRSTELLGIEAADRWAGANEILAATGRWEGQVRQQRRDGGQLVVLCRWSLQRDAAGAPRTILETHSDVTERVEAEAALDRMRDELAHSARLSTLGELTASIAHEINQPLAAISASGEACLRWLRRDEPDIAETTASVERMVTSAQRASQIVSRLRALVRRSGSERSRLVVDDLVEEVRPLLQRELRAHKVSLAVERDGTGTAIVGDRIQLQQVLINLMVNAMQAMDAVTDRPRELKVAVVPEAGDEARVLITVSDTGPGFAAGEGEQLFSPFFTTKPQGMGIGLSICRRIVEAHGGRITAAPAEPAGAIFTISLPAAEEDQA